MDIGAHCFMRKNILIMIFYLGCVSLMPGAGIFPEEISQKDLDKAISAMRDVRQERLTEEEKIQKSNELDDAQQILLKGGYKSVERIVREFMFLDSKNIRDDFFRLEACGALTDIDAEKTAGVVDKSLSKVDLNTNPYLVYDICHKMACTHNPDVIPVLRYFLKAAFDGTYYIRSLMAHSFRIDFPIVTDFVYGTYGPDSATSLLKILSATENDVETRACIYLLTKFKYLPALPVVRNFVNDKRTSVRSEAIKSLGVFSQPEDRYLLERLIADKNPEIRCAAVYALGEFCDPDSTPAIIPLLQGPDEKIRREAAFALLRLAATGGLKACVKYMNSGEDEKLKANIRAALEEIKKNSGLNIEDWKSLKDKQFSTLSQAIYKFQDNKYKLKPDDKKLSHEVLLQVFEIWKNNKSISGEPYAWVETRHILSAALDEDIGKVLEVRSRVLERQSDECWYEVEHLNEIVSILYRRKIKAKRPELPNYY
jgi:HEAT repeat protein